MKRYLCLSGAHPVKGRCSHANWWCSTRARINFVLSCHECNNNKLNFLVDKSYITKIEERNSKLLSLCQTLDHSELIAQEFANYTEGIIEKMWDYAKTSGFRERNVSN